jgi:hypothetical protein
MYRGATGGGGATIGKQERGEQGERGGRGGRRQTIWEARESRIWVWCACRRWRDVAWWMRWCRDLA